MAFERGWLSPKIVCAPNLNIRSLLGDFSGYVTIDRTKMRQHIRDIARVAKATGKPDKLRRAALLDLALFSGVGKASGHDVFEDIANLGAETARWTRR
jgi:hypothetical protein